jgi:hypothetical protein
MTDPGRRGMKRHLTKAQLPAGKTLAAFDFENVPMVIQCCTCSEWLRSKLRHLV